MARSPFSLWRRLLGCAVFAWLSARGVVGAQEAPLKTPPSLDDLLLFFPTKFPTGDWQPQNLQHEDVWLDAEDGTRIHGWYCPCERPRAVLLIAHGNAGNIATRCEWLAYLQDKMRVTTLIFDYRGYGRSEGVPSSEGVLQDARAARAKLRALAGVQDNEILLMGESIGGAVAAQLAAEAPPRGLILQSTFTSLKDMAKVHYPRLAWLVPKNKLDTQSALAKIRVPLLQSHGAADRTVPVNMAEQLFKAANEPKRLVAIGGADHNDWLTDQYLRELATFIQRVAEPAKP
jgi:fermentation-respiration switch protein FrsA (DUF1100 family)